MKSPNADRVVEQAPLPWESLPRVKAGSGFQLLGGIKVLDLTTSVAGPYSTMLLSDFGAEVIKIERPQGDDARHWGPPFLEGQALWFAAVNRNKKSVVLDLRSAEGRSDLDALIAEVDVFVTNQPTDVQRKLGLDYASVSKLNQGIVFVSISGFGLSGERSELTCYDLIAEGYSGIMDITGTPDRPPQKVGAPAADMLAGQDAAMATMAALYERRESGRGREIDISLVESMTRFLTCRISSYLGSGEVPARSGGTDSVIAIYQSFATADEPLTLGLGSDGIWKRFWSVLGEPDYADNAEFGSNSKRRNHREQIVADIQVRLKARTRSEWLEIFAKARIPAGPINSVDQLVQDKALQDRGMFFNLDDGGAAAHPQIGLGILIDGKPAVARSAPPTLGQHTTEILGALRQR